MYLMAGSGETPGPTVKVWMGEGEVLACARSGMHTGFFSRDHSPRWGLLFWPQVIMVQDINTKYMEKALELAAKGLGRTSPNPAVGAVVVKEGRIIGEGYHKKAGTAHAEVVALQQAGSAAEGADLYVTLEPCNHYGKTPPCTEAIINAGIKRVFAAVLDPNPLVAGKGINRLREAGVEVFTGIMEEKASALNEFFFKFITRGLPFVALKIAMTLDGKIAAETSDSRWITGEDARTYVHELRNIYDAVLTGSGTVIKDDPMLNTRLERDDIRDPVRLIVDSRLRIPLSAKVFKTASRQKTIVYTTAQGSRARAEELRAAGVEVVVTGEKAGHVDIVEMLRDAAERGITSVMVEAGSGLNGCLLENKLVDKVYWFIAPKIIGGKTAPGPAEMAGRERMADALMLSRIKVEQFGNDVLITGYL